MEILTLYMVESKYTRLSPYMLYITHWVLRQYRTHSQYRTHTKQGTHMEHRLRRLRSQHTMPIMYMKQVRRLRQTLHGETPKDRWNPTQIR